MSQEGRQEKKIIRFRKDRSGETKVSPNNHSQAGTEGGAPECDITNVYIGDLVVVFLAIFYPKNSHP